MSNCGCLKAASEVITPCECAVAGFCKRHNCDKHPHWHNLCKTSPAYFRLWEDGRGPCRNIPPPVGRRGLGDVISTIIRILTFGCMRPKPGCGCDKRKAWLNSLWSWKKNAS